MRVAPDGWIAGWRHEGGGFRVDRYDPVAKKDIGPLQLEGALRQYFSPDLRQVAVGQAVETGVRWRVYDVRTGAELGELVREGKDGPLAFVLLAGDAIVTRPAVDPTRLSASTNGREPAYTPAGRKEGAWLCTSGSSESTITASTIAA